MKIFRIYPETRSKFSSIAWRKNDVITCISLSKYVCLSNVNESLMPSFLENILLSYRILNSASQSSCFLSHLRWIKNIHHQSKLPFQLNNNTESSKWGTIMMNFIKTKALKRQGQRKASILKVSCLYIWEATFHIWSDNVTYTLCILVQVLDTQEIRRLICGRVRNV